MKIGIMTLWKTDFNYGAVLQCYSLQEHLRKKGHNPFLIRYSNETVKRSLRRFTISKALKLLRDWYKAIKTKNVIDENRFFEEFRKQYLNPSPEEYMGYDAIKNNPPIADMYIVGSDQVWNFYDTPIEYSKGPIHAFFLDFGDNKTLKISYAASCDKKYLLESHINEIRPLMGKLDYVSVREKSGLEVCEECGRKDAECVVDPTLMLSADEYRKIYKENTLRQFPSNYILVYMVLTQKIKFDIEYIYNFAREKGIEVIYVAEDKTDDKHPKCYPTIPEWLYLIDNAKYVITNSFHGTVFSLIFHKQYATIPLDGYSKNTNKRIENLCEFFCTKTRYVKNKDLSVLDEEYEANYIYKESGFDKFLDLHIREGKAY